MSERQIENDPLTERIIGAAIEVHRHLGPGLLESIYEDCLSHELELNGLRFERQIATPLVYKGFRVGDQLSIDLLVEDEVVVELKAQERLLYVHQAQLLTYMRLSGKPKGLLINFNHSLLADGVKRMVL